MLVLRQVTDIATHAPGLGLHLALGYFDGLHLGHQSLLDCICQYAKERGGAPGVVLLEPQPQSVLGKGGNQGLLNTLDEKIRLIQAYGDIHVFILPFDLAFAALCPEDFVRDYLVHIFHIRTAVCGFSYHFGKDGSGDSRMLQHLAAEYGFACAVQQPVSRQGNVVSSTAVRGLIEEGRMFEAYALLGHCHVFSGRVVGGKGIGSTMGFPTANVAIAAGLIWPAFGVYGAFVRDEDGHIFQGVINVGLRPTVNRESLPESFEVHLMAYSGDLYGRRLQMVLTGRLRPEKAFADLPALQAQITRDAKEAEGVLRQWEEHLAGGGMGRDAVFSCFIEDYPI